MSELENLKMARPFKYNPSFLSDEELLVDFSVRQNELNAMLDCAGKSKGKTNRHLLIVGVRGSGKTMLLRRFLLAVKNDPKLLSFWHPVSFAEENYEILTLNDFWFQMLYYLSPPFYEKVKQYGGNDVFTEEKGLSYVLDFADQIGKKILLVCENMGDLIETFPKEDAQKLKKTLQEEKRIMLVGSSTTLFDDPTHPFDGFFKVISLKRLSGGECKKLWLSVAEKKISPTQARALEILTGGSPRLLSILAWFGKDLSFLDLMKELDLLVDDHTDYFKGQMETLPPKERKVFATLARLWANSGSAEVAAEARMEQTETASLLNRLVKRGIVEKSSSGGSKKRGQTYQLVERLFNIYYLMRLGGRASLWVRPVVEFLAQVFGADITEELFDLDYPASDHRTRRCVAMLMTAIDFGETVDREALTYFESGEFTKALEIANKAWEVQAKAFGEEYSATLKALNHLATGYLAVGDFDKSLELSQKAYDAMCRVLGREDTETLCALGNICTAYAHKENYAKSLELMKTLFSYPDFLVTRHQYTSMLCITLAAISPEVAAMTLKTIENSPSSEVLNVLAAGIKAWLGIEFRAPQEVREIAEDIKGWIAKIIDQKTNKTSL